MVAFQQKILQVVKYFRTQWPLFSNSERTTVCGADCMLMALQLSMAEVNKQYHGDFTVSLSDVLETWNYLLRDKLGLYENMKEPENYADVKKAYHAFLARSNMLDLIDIYQKCYSLGLLAEDESISPVQLLEFISGVMNAQGSSGSVLCTPTQINRQDQEHMKMATSFIRTIELGGRDSASSLYDPLRVHVKGLSNFVNFIDKLQEIVGEVLNTRIAGGRILSTVKMHLIKGRSNGDPFCQAVEEVVQDLDLKIKNIVDSQQETLTASTPGVSPARPKLHSINHGTAYCGRDTVKVLLVLLDEEAVNPPTQNKADLLCDNESLNLCGITSVLTLFSSPARSSGSSPKPLRQRILKSMDGKVIKMKQSSIKSQFACTYKNDLSEMSGQHSHGIPTCKRPVLPKQHLKTGKCAEGTNSCLDVPGLGTISESVHQTRSYAEMEKLSCQPKKNNSENEQMDLKNDKIICDKESEPSLQKNTKRLKTSNSSEKESDSKIGGKRKQTKTAHKNKLIAGQAKLTRYFQV
ncbi:PCNA-interacting partner isoform X3 [Catharus ustulatus]|uniref:PCNA-interacting partner isoform X3 n=1 Tax=Catharus ustulatus TaxID=91951 RepID=UPI00140CB25D|nr:PCNA-interacting partner isoform X3 [Catharus ustulatus]